MLTPRALALLVLLAPRCVVGTNQQPITHASRDCLAQRTGKVLRRRTRLYDDALARKPLENVTVSDPGQYLYTVPWLDPHAHSRPYIGLHNDLDALLRVQASDDGIITWTFFTNVWRTMLMNFAYSLMRYGKVTSFIVVTLDEPSLRTCIGLRLPCYNASSTAPLIAGMLPLCCIQYLLLDHFCHRAV